MVKLTISKNDIKNILFGLYFISILNMAITGNNMFWHVIMIICSVWGIIDDRKRILNKLSIPLVLCFITSVLNIAFVGNLSITRIMLIMLSWLMIVFVYNTQINTRVLRITLLVVNLFLIYRIYQNGFSATSFFLAQSYNYISIYSILPVVMYYFFASRNKERIVLWPALLSTVTCILGFGRGGIISAFIVLLGVMVNNMFFVNEKVGIKKIVFVIVIFLTMVAIVFSIDKIANIVYFQKLTSYGLDSRGRTDIWLGYIRKTIGNFEYFLFGTDTNAVYEMLRYNGNVHNSLLNIHLYNGIFIFIMCMYKIFQSVSTGIKNKDCIFLVCLLTLLMRGFTDNFLWGSFGMMPFLILIYEQNKHYENMENDIEVMNR